MNLDQSPELDAFRMTVRDFFEKEFPKDIIEKNRRGASLTTEDIKKSEQALASRGWLVPAWPVEYGGTGWTIEEQYVFDEELERAGVPTVTPMGAIYTFGTDDQKERWLPGIRDGQTSWGQGYSEPGSGSDLASLQFQAVKDGEEYVLNGTKIWTSAAQHADWMFLLTRTDNSGKKQEGITFICVDINTPGVVVHPIITIDGKYVLSRVEFTDVRVPLENRIGEEGKGWTYSQYLLGHERTSYARIGSKRKSLQHLKEVAAATSLGGNRTLLEDTDFRAKLADAELNVDKLEMTVFRILSVIAAGGTPGNEASILKIMATETAQQITELFLEAAATNGMRSFDDSVTPDWASKLNIPDYAAPEVSSYFGTRAQSIYGGTNEIQKNIIAKRVLGL